MIALINFPAFFCGERIDRIKFQHARPCRRQALKEGARCADGTDAIVNQIYLHPCALLVDKRLDKRLADFVILDDVSFNIDMILRR